MTTEPQQFKPEEIEAMLDNGQVEFKDGQIIAVGALQGETIMKDVATATVYDTRTGVSSSVRVYDGNNTLMKMLSKRDPETGRRIFSVQKPNIEPPKAETPCWLNPNHPRFEEFRQMGMPVCKGSTLASEQDAEQHVKNKHRRAWELIQARDRQRKEDEDRAFQRTLLETLVKGTQGASTAEATCPECSQVFASEHGLKVHVGREHKLEV